MSGPPQLSVVCATRDRPERLAALLESLRQQTLAADAFEVIVVDDASGPETVAVLEAAPGVRVLRQTEQQGPAAARNRGWQAARAEVIAFIDDDCVASPHWAQSGLAASLQHPGAIVQGRVDPIPDELASFGPWSHSLWVHEAGPWFETANIFYPRSILEALGGFDSGVFDLPAGEDTDLAWRALASGATAVMAGDAQAYHAVLHLGPAGKLRRATRWRASPLLYKRHPQLRRELTLGLFWSPMHYEFARALLGLLFWRRHRFLARMLIAPYYWRLAGRRSGPLLAPYLIVHDTVEIASVMRGAVRHRVAIL